MKKEISEAKHFRIVKKGGRSILYGFSPEGRKELDESVKAGIETVIRIPEVVSVVGEGAFLRCGMTEVILPEGLAEIGVGAFSQCIHLKEIRIPENVVKIGSTAFCSCTSLEKVLLPEGLKKIGSWAFGCCSRLVKIEIPDSVDEIRANAFCGCTSLLRADLPGNLKKAGTSIFKGCLHLRRSWISPDLVFANGDIENSVKELHPLSPWDIITGRIMDSQIKRSAPLSALLSAEVDDFML